MAVRLLPRTLPDTSVDINNKDHVAYLANYTGGGQGIFLENGLLVSTGDVVSGRTIASLFRPYLNDNDMIVAYATFTDGSSGIITAVPEPVVAVMLVLMGFASCRVRFSGPVIQSSRTA